MHTLYIFIFFIFGTIFGSFFNVVACRLSKGKSIIAPPSSCDSCGKRLKWYELIPILSYIFLGGKCKSCKAKISPSNLIIEIVTGILFATCYNKFLFTPKLILALLFVSTLIIIIVSDIEYMIILDEVLFVGIVSIIVYYLNTCSLVETGFHVLDGVYAFLTIYALKLLGDFIFNKESLGGGDIKLMFLFGLVLGFDMSIVAVFLGTFLAFPIALYVLFSRRDNMIPFGPFLAIASIVIFITNLTLDKIINYILI